MAHKAAIPGFGKKKTPMAMSADAFDPIYRKSIFRFFRRRLSRPADAEDLTQEVFVRLLRYRRTESEKDISDALVFTIASNLLRDYARRKAVRKNVIALDDAALAEADHSADTTIDPERVLIGKEAVSIAMAALSALETRTQEIFLLFHFEEMKQREIASLCGVSFSTVQKHLVKAMTAITAAIEAQRGGRS
jgi:RNA polymerase sigma factor (sigma-70 family)